MAELGQVALSEQDVRFVERFLESVRGVLSSRLVVDESKRIAAVRLLSTTERPVNQVIQDVQSALLARYGVSLAPADISVAQIADGQGGLAANRFRFIGVTSGVYREEQRAEVFLAFRGAEYRGEARGAAGPRQELRLVALATLAAVESCLGWRGLLALEDLVTAELAGRQAVLAALLIAAQAAGIHTLGCGYVLHDEREAVARAVLDGLNRQLGILA